MRIDRLRDWRPESEAGAKTGQADALPRPLFGPDPLAEVVTDPEGIVRGVSPAAGVLLRAAPAYLIGLPLRALVHRTDRPRLLGLLAAAENDGASVHLAVPGGVAVMAELSVNPVRDAEGYVVGLRWRIAERRSDDPRRTNGAEPALRRRLERLAESGHGVCLLRADGMVTWMGATALLMLRYELGQVVGNAWAELTPEAARDAHTPLALALRRGREGSGTFHRVARGDGTQTALDYVALPLIEDDRVEGAALAFTEVGPR